jgi:hypothetical protein
MAVVPLTLSGPTLSVALGAPIPDLESEAKAATAGHTNQLPSRRPIRGNLSRAAAAESTGSGAAVAPVLGGCLCEDLASGAVGLRVGAIALAARKAAVRAEPALARTSKPVFVILV